jgi:tripartite ATP-independent transporter DctM subunit
MNPASETSDVPKTAFGRVVVAIEKWAMVLILALMALLPVVEMASRRLFGAGVPGSALWVQHLTLWAGFLGALLATRAGKHLSLATGDLLPAGRLRHVARIYVASLSAGVCMLLAYASYNLVKADSARAGTLPAGIPEWWSEAIMPVALFFVSLRFVPRASERWWGRAVALLAIGLCFALVLFETHANALLWPGVILILVGVLLGTPVFVAMAGIAMMLFFAEGTPIAAVPTETYRLVASPTLPAIPLLTAAGYVLAEGGASKRLVRLARAYVGWMPGGMALMVCFVCAGFTTFTGGSGVTILALGGLVLPMLLDEKYPEGFSLGLVTSSGSLGLLFPPSLPVILYAVVAGASVEELYIAGFIPCLLLVLLVAAYGVVMGVRYKAPRTVFSAREAVGSLWEAKFEIVIPILVVASIFTGYATMVESAALAVVLAVFSQSFIFKDLHPVKQLPDVLVHAATLVGAVVILLGVAMGLTSYLVDAEIPALVLTWTKAHIHSQVLFLLALNAVLLVLGSVLEIFSAIVILAPLLAPMGAAYGIDPLHLGIIFLANLELGFLFPPMGLNLILSSSRFGKPLSMLYRVALPFLLIMTAGVLLVTYVPAMTNGFLRLVKGQPAVATPVALDGQ